MATDFLRAEITAQLAPRLANAGFTRFRPKHFVRIRGELIQNIAFQLSQWGSKVFNVHLFVSTMFDPEGNLNGSRVGRRLQRDEDVDTPWEASTGPAAKAAMASATTVICADPLRWLLSVDTLRDYVYEYVADPQTSASDFELGVVLARTGVTNRALWNAEKVLQAPVNPDYDVEIQQRLRERAKALRASIGSGTVQQLIDDWKRAFVEANGIGELSTASS